jgi:hypothetical protein
MREIWKSGGRSRETYFGKRRFEHWYRDQQVYFITAICRGRTPAFTGVEAQAIFWRQFERYTAEFGFEPWVTALVFNHGS